MSEFAALFSILRKNNGNLQARAFPKLYQQLRK